MTRQNALLLSCIGIGLIARTTAAAPIDIGSRLELMVDRFLIAETKGTAELRLHHPTPHEVVLVHDEPWEGSGCGYHTIFRDGDKVRMYYKSWQITVANNKLTQPHELVIAYAESKDGLTWTKPDLGLVEFNGSKDNNIIWKEKGSHDFNPFRDPNPTCKPDARYKAVGYVPRGLHAWKSPDGIHWTKIQPGPVMTGCAFDTQNLAFYDSVRGEYRAYVRHFKDGVRGIMTATSKDFVHWTKPVWLEYPPGTPTEHLYTNQVQPYYRAPHLFIGFPTRYIERGWSPSMRALPELEHRKLRATGHLRYGTAITEGLLMTSRDGLRFHRWGEAFLRPGPQRKGQWKYGDNYIAWHVIETPSPLPGVDKELSLYATEGYWTGTQNQLRRHTIRIDGFVSLHADYAGGEMITKPLVFEGKQLIMNYATSAAGSIRIEIQDATGKPIPGYTLADCPEIYGDTIAEPARWKGGQDVAKLAGKPVRLRFVMKDADLYAIQFK